MKFTLDTNIIIAIKNNETATNDAKQLIDLHCKGIKIYVCWASAAERKKGSENRNDFMELNTKKFKGLLKSTGLDHLPQIPVVTGRWGQAYWGCFKWGSKNSKISNLADLAAWIMFKKSHEDLVSNSDNKKDWSKIRDVEIFASHVDERCDVLVTMDSHFLDNSPSLKEMVEREYNYKIEILEPKNALQKAHNFLNFSPRI